MSFRSQLTTLLARVFATCRPNPAHPTGAERDAASALDPQTDQDAAPGIVAMGLRPLPRGGGRSSGRRRPAVTR